MLQDKPLSRRQLLINASAAACVFAAGCHSSHARESLPTTAPASTAPTEKIIDIHQHTTYLGRSNAALLHHQRRMGATQTILLPGGSPVETAATAKGKFNGLYAGAGTVETCIPIAREHPHQYYFGANEVPDIPEAHDRIEAALKQGAVIIAEQKFSVAVDSPEMERIYALARDYNVPILMHFQYDTFNTAYERFGKVLEKWHRVNFIGHAVSFWSNIDANLGEKKVGYPTGPVKPGGLTDRYLSDYGNFYGDLSAYSGLNALIRDEEHARGFLDRHQNQLLFGSDCPDPAGFGPTCTGANMIAALRRLSRSKTVERKLLFDNANGLFRL
jgi:predicted TIM-barrel fold metal-dependent hydrolase